MTFLGGLEAGGWAVVPLLVLAVPGLALGVLSLGLSSRRTRHYLGLGALGVSTLLSMMAIGGALSIREKGEVTLQAAKELGPIATLRARRGVLLDSRIPLRLGLGAALIPLLGGLTGALSIRRSRRGKPASTRSLRSPSAPFGNLRVAVGCSAIAGVAAIGTATLLFAPIRGPSIPTDSPVWDALEAIDRMKSGVTSSACVALESAAARGGTDPKLCPDAQSAASECFEVRFEEALSSEPSRSMALLEELAHSPLRFSKDQHARLDGEIRRFRVSGSSSPSASSAPRE